MEAVGWIVAVVVGIPGFLAGVRGGYRFVSSVVHTQDKVTLLLASAERIEAEFSANHGSSLRDAIDRVEDKVDKHLANHR